MIFPSSFQELFLSLPPVMSKPTFYNFIALLPGWLFAPRRTVTGMLQAAGLAGERHHSIFHRLFATARWSLDELGLAVCHLMLPWIPQEQTVFLAADDTLARKRGLQVFGVGMHHDPLLSTRRTAIMNWGHSWVVLGVVMRFPFRPEHYFCLPVLFRLYRNRKTAAQEGNAYRKRSALLVDMLRRLCQAHPQRRFHLVVDSSYSGNSVAKQLPGNCDLTGRAHLDAQLFAPAPERDGKTQGRPRKKGRRLASPRAMLRGRTQTLTLNSYGRKDSARVAACQALWYRVAGQRPVRVVVVQPVNSGRPLQAFYSTRADDSAVEVLTRYARRWSIEVSFQDTKSHLGFEEPQGWTRNAVERTAPTAMLLYSLILLWFAKEGFRHVTFPHRPWYTQKRHVCFADMLRTLRRLTLDETFIQPRPPTTPVNKHIKTLVNLIAMAA